MGVNGRTARQSWLYVLTIVSLGIGSYNLLGGRLPSVLAQNGDAFLSRRIDQVEQRFYSVESRLNRLESEAGRSTILSSQTPNTNDVELQFLRTQVDGLRTRVGELECGVLRLDERTLSPGVRAAHKQSTRLDPCRQDPSSQVQLSARP
ncbi:MAG: hypothetical protein JO053_02655 [Acidobacteria bacterium]|nr:hypothetical protein [Acidobacteriota bacterium]